jgi:GT2 family glycosyltransferase
LNDCKAKKLTFGKPAETRKMISIIILVHNGISMSLQCFESLSKALADLDHEVILMDNASTESVEPLLEYGHLFHHFHFYRSEENLPFSTMNNRCAEKARGDLLLFINNDVFVERECVEHLIGCISSDRLAGIAGGMLLFPSKTAVQQAGMRQMLWGYASNYGVGAQPTDQRVLEPCEMFALTGAMICLPRKMFYQVQGFNEGYTWGYEDVDLCLKIKSAGFKVLYNPEAIAVHVQSATLGILQNGDQISNYRLYRKTWDPLIVPREESYIRNLKSQGIYRVVVFGTGMAASGLAGIVADQNIQIVAFTSSRVRDTGETFLEKPLLPLSSLKKEQYDRLIVGSQFFFEVENVIRDFDPCREPIFPVLQ